jgi:signal transduction histidine kinase/L-asparagine transporter-like permease
MGGSNQSLFLIGALIVAQGSAAVPLLVGGLLLSFAAAPGWLELVAMWPNRVGGIAATCAEAFRPYSSWLANLTGTCYWWGWVPTCGLTALLSASALHEWYLPGIPVKLLATMIVVIFAAVNLCGIRWAVRLAMPLALISGALAFLSTVVPVVTGHVNWTRASTFHLTSPFPHAFGALTSAMAGLYLIGFAAPAFEAAACHVGEMRNPVSDLKRAMLASGGMAGVYFIALPVVWLGVFGPKRLTGDLASTLGPTFAPLLAGGARAAAIWFMVFNMFHGTLQPLAGASRTLMQLSEDGLLPRVFARRSSLDVPWVATLLTASMSVVLLLVGDPTWMLAAANLCYLISIAMPSIAVWLLRRHDPGRPRPYRAPRGTITLGLVAAFVWLLSTVLGFEQFGLPTVLLGLGFAYSGSFLYAARLSSERRRAGLPRSGRSLHMKLTGAMLAVLTLDGIGYLLAVGQVGDESPVLRTVLEDIFVAVALLTIAVGLVLPGMISHAVQQVARAADALARQHLAELTGALEDLGDGNLQARAASLHVEPVVVHSSDEIGAMAKSFNTMQSEVEQAGAALVRTREQLRRHRDHLEELVADRTAELTEVNVNLERAEHDRRELLGLMLRGGEDERIRLAADLHDGPIQRLAALGLTLDRSGLRLGRGDADGAAELVRAVQHSLRDEISSLRRLMAELRPPVLDQGGLDVAIRDHASAFSQRTGVECRVVAALDQRLPSQIETLLYRLAQEALANVAKHAGASQVNVQVTPLDMGVELMVSDDGKGFVIGSEADRVKAGHFGLASMRERIEMAGGSLQLWSHPGGGTRVAAWLPVLEPATQAVVR